jgi:hypothetical protein
MCSHSLAATCCMLNRLTGFGSSIRSNRAASWGLRVSALGVAARQLVLCITAVSYRAFMAFSTGSLRKAEVALQSGGHLAIMGQPGAACESRGCAEGTSTWGLPADMVTVQQL